ncbi:MAG TPA: serine/threonine-protein kinase, partial [Kofleriaceae bacterium]
IAAAMRAARTAAPAATDDVLITGSLVGRYVVSSLLGVGGLGRVYAAYDPSLDRRIAVKLVRDPALATEASLARLAREAQLTAKLSHPNVVTVYDVGIHAGQVFIAMELAVDTISGWLERAPKPWREVLRLFRDAGQGLVAAHAAGLVHRDIKPDNLLVGDDGRVRVSDFGLARLEADAHEGAVIGTPAYMAPEQAAGEPSDARADQYSLAISLREALVDPPRWVRDALRRALAERPDDRYPSVAELLSALDPAPRTRRRWIAAGAIGALAIGGGFAWTATRAPVAPPCEGSVAIDGVWTSDARERLTATFLASGKPYASATSALVARMFDDYVASWRTVQHASCTATYVQHGQSDELFDRKAACLEVARSALAEQLHLFATDRSLVDRAVGLAGALPPPSECDKPQALAWPRDPVRRAQIEPLHGRIAEAEVLARNARFTEAAAAIAALRPVVANLAFPPLEAMLDEAAGQLAEMQFHGADAIAAYDRAALRAEAGGDDLAKARAWIGGARSRAMQAKDPALATRLFDQARATIARLGGSPELELRLELAQGAVLLIQGDFTAALAHQRAAVVLAEHVYGKDTSQTASARTDLAQSLERTAAYAEGERVASASLAALEAELGPYHPSTIRARAILGQVLFDQAKYDAAFAEQQKVLEATRTVYGADAEPVWSILSDLARTHEAKQEYAQALDLFQRAQVIVDHTNGVGHPNAALIRINVATAQLELQHWDLAVASFRDAIAMAKTAVGADNIFEANAESGIAVAWRASHPAEALVAAREAVRLFEKLEGPAHPDTGRGYHDLGRVQDALGQTREARASLEHALAIRVAALGKDHPDAADTQFALAELLAREGERDRARLLAKASAAAFAAAGDTISSGEIRQWLTTH